jgi:hypothetical protein
MVDMVALKGKESKDLVGIGQTENDTKPPHEMAADNNPISPTLVTRQH